MDRKIKMGTRGNNILGTAEQEQKQGKHDTDRNGEVGTGTVIGIEGQTQRQWDRDRRTGIEGQTQRDKDRHKERDIRRSENLLRMG